MHDVVILIVHLFDTLIRQRFIPGTETPSAEALAKSMRSTQVHTIAHSILWLSLEERASPSRGSKDANARHRHSPSHAVLYNKLSSLGTCRQDDRSLPGFEPNSQYIRNTPSTEDNFISLSDTNTSNSPFYSFTQQNVTTWPQQLAKITRC